MFTHLSISSDSRKCCQKPTFTVKCR